MFSDNKMIVYLKHRNIRFYGRQILPTAVASSLFICFVVFTAHEDNTCHTAPKIHLKV